MKSDVRRHGWGAKLVAAFAAATIAAPLGAATIVTLGPAVQAYADETQGQWVESGGRRWYKNADGSYPSSCWMKIDDSWYHFDAAGWMQTGWLKDGDAWYYLRSNENLDDYGQMVKSMSWDIDGKRYHFFEDGHLAQNEALAFPESGFTPGEYYYFCEYYGADGVHVDGWAKIPEFTLHRPISDVPGPFGSAPQMGTSAVPGGWIYQGDYGTMYWYWQQIDGVWYYFQPYNYLGQRVDNPSFNPEQNRPAYFLMATGWCRPVGESSWYYLGTSGAMQTGWVNDGGTWYWLTGSGAMATGWQKIDGTWYYFNASGAMQTGWQKIDGSWYCFAASGAMLHDCWAGNYYLGSSGAMLTDARTPDGYYVGADGAWVPGR